MQLHHRRRQPNAPYMYGRASDGRSIDRTTTNQPISICLSVDPHLLVEKPGLPTGNLGTCCVVACAAAPSQRDGDIYNQLGWLWQASRDPRQLLLNVEQALPAGGLPDVQMSARASEPMHVLLLVVPYYYTATCRLGSETSS
jgi:hypothetical protein